MPRRRHKPRQKPVTRPYGELTEAQRLALIPGGSVNPHRARRDDIALETRALTEAGGIAVTGEYVSTPVKKLLSLGEITLDVAFAALLYQTDHDTAYASFANALAGVFVNGGKRGGTGGMDTKLAHGQRFQKARACLSPSFATIADAAILCLPNQPIEPSFKGIGAFLRPGAPARSQQESGKTALMLLCQELARIYEKMPRIEHKGDAA